MGNLLLLPKIEFSRNRIFLLGIPKCIETSYMSEPSEVEIFYFAQTRVRLG